MDEETAEVVKDMIAGTLGGVTGIIAGQPADTIKVRQQTATLTSGQAVSAAGALRALLRDEGPRALFKGMAAPIAGNAPINAIVFAVYGMASRALQQRAADEEMGPLPHFLAGGLSGAAQAVVAGPMELVKIQLQVAKTARKPASHLRHMVRESGWRRGFFGGFGMTVARDFPAFGVYFATYAVLKRQLPGADEGKMLPALLAGGAAGVASWLLTHPLDVLKSCVQAVPPDAPAAERSVAHVLRSNVRAHGAQFLVQGLGVSVTRAFPVSAIVFVVYEWSFAWLNRIEEGYRQPEEEPSLDEEDV